jgi:hypothetical protein
MLSSYAAVRKHLKIWWVKDLESQLIWFV